MAEDNLSKSAAVVAIAIIALDDLSILQCLELGKSGTKWYYGASNVSRLKFTTGENY